MTTKEGHVFGRLLLGLLLILGISGCATMKRDSSATDLQGRVNELERQLEEKDNDLADLRDQMQGLSEELKLKQNMRQRGAKETSSGPSALSASRDGAIRVNASAQQVQTALQKAGFYSGPIDGKIGEKTRRAIAEFQKSNNLNPDGVVGKKTWMELKTFLE